MATDTKRRTTRGKGRAVTGVFADKRCAQCKRGHYSLPDGSLTNGPCGNRKCECFVCDDLRDRSALAIEAVLAALYMETVADLRRAMGFPDAEQEA